VRQKDPSAYLRNDKKMSSEKEEDVGGGEGCSRQKRENLMASSTRNTSDAANRDRRSGSSDIKKKPLQSLEVFENLLREPKGNTAGKVQKKKKRCERRKDPEKGDQKKKGGGKKTKSKAGHKPIKRRP